ncbi:MAG: hypothetical protein ACLFVI_08240 [Archaeoglobaceae archaeon]
MLVIFLVSVLIILLYYELLAGKLSTYFTNKKRNRISKDRLEAIEKAHRIADDAIKMGIPKEKIKPKKIRYGNSAIDVEEIYEDLLEAHIKVV